MSCKATFPGLMPGCSTPIPGAWVPWGRRQVGFYEQCNLQLLSGPKHLQQLMHPRHIQAEHQGKKMN